MKIWRWVLVVFVVCGVFLVGVVNGQDFVVVVVDGIFGMLNSGVSVYLWFFFQGWLDELIVLGGLFFYVQGLVFNLLGLMVFGGVGCQVYVGDV